MQHKDETKKLLNESGYFSFNQNEINVSNNSDYRDDPSMKIENNFVAAYLTKMDMICFIIVFLTLVPEILILLCLTEQKSLNYFYETWWLLIPSSIIILSISIFAYCYRNSYDLHCTSKIKILFVFYLISILIIITVISFKLVKICLCLTVFITISFLILFIMNSFEIFNNKNWVKLSVLFIYFFVFMIVYLFVINNYFVEFFVVIILSALFFTYFINEVKRNFIYYVKENKINKEGARENIYNNEWSMYNLIFSSIMIIKIDILYASFR